jgi:hypothetical protein
MKRHALNTLASLAAGFALLAVAAVPVSAATLLGAHGSEVFRRVVENACQEGPAAYHCIGSYSVTGGTGRFEHATGTGNFDGHVSFNPDGSGSFQATYFGQISGAK